MTKGSQPKIEQPCPRVRITNFWQILKIAKNREAVCEWILNNAGSGLCRMYWPIPNRYFAVCSSHLFFASFPRRSTEHEPQPPLPEIGTPLPEIKFVRLSWATVEKVAREAARNNMFQENAIMDDRFLGGLSNGDADDGYEELPGLLELRVKSASLNEKNAWESMEIVPTQVFIDNSMFKHILSLLKHAPIAAPEAARPPDTATAVPLKGVSDTARQDSSNDIATTTGGIPGPWAGTCIPVDDPYGLRGRSDAVYALYVTATLCARNQEFRALTGAKLRKKRRAIAHALFQAQLNNLAAGTEDDAALGMRLASFMCGVRLDHGLARIDADYDINTGLEAEDFKNWPPPPAKALLAEPDDNRRDFVTPMLALLISGAQYWWSLKNQNPIIGPGNNELLARWLETFGLVGVQTRRTSFEVIVWNGKSVPHVPESVEPLAAPLPTGGESHASPAKS